MKSARSDRRLSLPGAGGVTAGAAASTALSVRGTGRSGSVAGGGKSCETLIVCASRGTYGGADECNAATVLTRLAGGEFLVETLQGTIRAKQVMAATDACTNKSMPWFRKRLINVGSFIIVTEPLGEARAKELIPNGRLLVAHKNVGHYVRLTPDNRLAFGGRARFAPSNPASDIKSGDILKREMTDIFPQLAGVRIDYNGTAWLLPFGGAYEAQGKLL